MKRYCLIATVFVVLAAFMAGAQENAPVPRGVQPNWNKKLWPTERNTTFAQMPKDPVKLFDNLYSVGFTAICAFAIPTSDGIVMIDSGWPETVDLLMNNVKAVSLDPSKIKYILVTHARVDHFGGAGKIKEDFAPGLRVGMSAADWTEAERLYKAGTKGQENSVPAPLARDLVINDGDTLKVGDTTFKFYVLPGTTPGSLGIEYQAKDRGKSYRTLFTGGIAMYADPMWGDAYIKSIERLKMLSPWDVLFGNHPFMAQPKDLGEIERDVATRGNGPNPAVAGPKKINAFFDNALKLAHEKQALELKASNSP
jgi:glyoxylase-like metal-dependent hydrolase (beta-lactamase superfamily II)